jgi:hypothetical protein
MAIFARKNQFGIEVDESMVHAAFLGTLRSELDEDATLEGAFAELYARFVTLRDSYDNGRLDAHSFGMALRDLRVIDTDGYQWTIGATTGKWYRRNQQEGGRWTSAPLPAGTGTLVDHTGQASGWAVEDWEQRRAQRLREDAERARAEEVRREAASNAKRKMSIEEMFDKYVETPEEAPTYSVDSTILVVEELPELPFTPPNFTPPNEDDAAGA